MSLNLSGVINDRSFGLVCLNFLNELSKLGQKISFYPIAHPIKAPEQYHEVIQTAINNQEYYDPAAPSLRVWHPFDLAGHVGRGKRVGYTIFELDRFTPRELHHMRSQDQVITCSKWGRDILANFNIKADVVPLGVDTDIFSPANIPRTLAKDDETVFLHCGKWEIRKGVDVLCEAFNAAFEKNDKVRLQLICFNPFLQKFDQYGKIVSDGNEEWKSYFKNSKLGDKIDVLPWLPTQYDVANVMRQADCGVFPARAEGWNLELLEMMACGKDVITTNYSAHTEFANKENAHLIDIVEIESAFDGVFFHGQGNWASFGEAQIDQLVEHMRVIYREKRHSGEVSLKNTVGIETARKLTWANAAKKLVEVIK